jgi:hypothetical protein
MDEWDPPKYYNHIILNHIDQAEYYALFDRFSPGITDIQFHDCEIRHLLLPESVEWLLAEETCIKSVKLPKSCKIAYLKNNFISRIDLPSCLSYLDLRQNKLTSVTATQPVERLEYLDLTDNPRLKKLNLTSVCKVTLKHDADLVIGNDLKIAGPEDFFFSRLKDCI